MASPVAWLVSCGSKVRTIILYDTVMNEPLMLYDKKITLALGLVTILIISASTFGRGVYAQITPPPIDHRKTCIEFSGPFSKACNPESIDIEGQFTTQQQSNHLSQTEEMNKAIIAATDTPVSNLERNVK